MPDFSDLPNYQRHYNPGALVFCLPHIDAASDLREPVFGIVTGDAYDRHCYVQFSDREQAIDVSDMRPATADTIKRWQFILQDAARAELPTHFITTYETITIQAA